MGMRTRLASALAVMTLVATTGPAWAAGKAKTADNKAVSTAKEAQAKDKEGGKTCDCCAQCEACKPKPESESRPPRADEPKDKPSDGKDKLPPPAKDALPGKGPVVGKDVPPPPKDVPPGAPDPDRTGLVKQFTPGSTDAVIRDAFKCALDFPDEASGFQCYAALNVESNRDNDIAVGQLRNYQWRFFRQRASGYLQEGQGFAFLVTRRDPGKVEATAKEAKVFLRHKSRDNPAPITLRKENGVWKIYANSLGF
jgi:hypothetical protein